MPPIQLKNGPTSAQTLTQEARTHVREAMRTTLASSPPPPQAADQIQATTEVKFGPKMQEFAAAESMNSRVLCCEEIDGRRWNYVVEMEGSRSIKKGASVRVVSLQSPMTPADVSFFFFFLFFNALVLVGFGHRCDEF